MDSSQQLDPSSEAEQSAEINAASPSEKHETTELAHTHNPAEKHPSDDNADGSQKSPTQASGDSPRGLAFWGIIAALCIASLLTALENTVVSTSLPLITRALDMGNEYVWVTNAFFLTRYVLCRMERGTERHTHS
jgi:hypothetical protein